MLQPSRSKGQPREGAGQLPALLLDQGELPDLLPDTGHEHFALVLRRGRGVDDDHTAREGRPRTNDAPLGWAVSVHWGGRLGSRTPPLTRGSGEGRAKT